MKNFNYIPSPSYWQNIFNQECYKDALIFKKRMPINKILIKEPYPNKIDLCNVKKIIGSFDNKKWEPLFIDSRKCLRDGIHRIEVARRLKLKYIDVVIENIT